MLGTRKVLEKLRHLRAESRNVGVELRNLRAEIRDLHAENMEMLRFTGEVIRRNELAFVEFRNGLGELREVSRAAREESRPQTRALFAVIDRLEGGTAG